MAARWVGPDMRLRRRISAILRSAIFQRGKEGKYDLKIAGNMSTYSEPLNVIHLAVVE